MAGRSLSNVYTYQEYQVQTVLEKLSPDENNLRPVELDGFAFPPDFPANVNFRITA